MQEARIGDVERKTSAIQETLGKLAIKINQEMSDRYNRIPLAPKDDHTEALLTYGYIA